jgi:hypothetical protein
VLELEDLEDGAVQLDVIAVLELVRADDGWSALSEPEFRSGSVVVRNARQLDHNS